MKIGRVYGKRLEINTEGFFSETKQMMEVEEYKK